MAIKIHKHSCHKYPTMAWKQGPVAEIELHTVARKASAAPLPAVPATMRPSKGRKAVEPTQLMFQLLSNQSSLAGSRVLFLGRQGVADAASPSPGNGDLGRPAFISSSYNSDFSKNFKPGGTRARLPNATMGTLSQNGSFPNLLGPQLSNKAV